MAYRELNRRLRPIAAAGLIAFGLASTSPASAAIVETLTLVNNYTYSLNGGPTTYVPAFSGNRNQREKDYSPSGHISEFGVDITSTYEGGNFSYLQNAYCVGTCTLTLNTYIDLFITNTGSDPVALRFDSLITPGHLAQTGINATAYGDFHFHVQQYDPAMSGREHYQTYGQTNFGDPVMWSSGPDPLNDILHDDNGTDWQVINWSASPVNVLLTSIPAGSTHRVHLWSAIDIVMDAQCMDLSDCPGMQIAFGDPRNSGGGTTARGAGPGEQPMIGRSFDPYTSSVFQVVEPTAPLPKTPDPLPAVTYGRAFVSQAVPEPSSWALMIAGLGLVGSLLRGAGVRVRAI